MSTVQAGTIKRRGSALYPLAYTASRPTDGLFFLSGRLPAVAKRPHPINLFFSDNDGPDDHHRDGHWCDRDNNDIGNINSGSDGDGLDGQPDPIGSGGGVCAHCIVRHRGRVLGMDTYAAT